MRREPPEVRNLLERILDTPHLEKVVPRLKPEVLHRVIQTCGLEDCGNLVALATPNQLQAVFNLDLWRPPPAGPRRTAHPDRFGQWLEVLMESGAAVAAQKLVGVDIDLVIAAMAQHLRVRDVAAATAYTTLDGELIDPKRRAGGGMNRARSAATRSRPGAPMPGTPSSSCCCFSTPSMASSSTG